MSFDYFQIQKCMLQTVRAEKVDEKSRVICLVSVKVIHLYASESSHYTLSENTMV